MGTGSANGFVPHGTPNPPGFNRQNPLRFNHLPAIGRKTKKIVAQNRPMPHRIHVAGITRRSNLEAKT
jgi:hypothetical protein